ncbi:Gfo/Idh/MocA family oxidoreductase [Acuticoccus sp. MNP-M23]|uniref:Gfo/Idh/MocA family protein n=1 Tax=Acuticoccus sp. MNP-M23 TaxID=3072793 RepID=UPI0028155977|nr:Gfo/Idh/MocA family oxidoreductase [Acuticoccus sp. MNP-M23]WMS42493.1 Gfo/Idh/MocA family oxidoreductase [Acuticoccus sp. MNP-M23]
MLKLGLVGIGAIARKAHVPAIESNPDLALVAAASRHGTLPGIASYTNLTDMLEGSPEIEAVVLCVPPEPRFDMAREAIAAGKHVFLEKPPGVTVSEVHALEAAARDAGVTLLASWHSRYAPGVETLRQRLFSTPPTRVNVTWREDVRVYHPGQSWIWEPGGYGVFDPLINAFSILTYILPRPFRAVSSRFETPSNCAQPIAAQVLFKDTEGVEIHCDASFDQPDPPTWDIVVETGAGTFHMQKGGAILSHDGTVLVDEPETEYANLYALFAGLVRAGRSDVDVTPLAHVADCFLLADHHTVGPFDESIPAPGA